MSLLTRSLEVAYIKRPYRSYKAAFKNDLSGRFLLEDRLFFEHGQGRIFLSSPGQGGGGNMANRAAHMSLFLAAFSSCCRSASGSPPIGSHLDHIQTGKTRKTPYSVPEPSELLLSVLRTDAEILSSSQNPLPLTLTRKVRPAHLFRLNLRSKSFGRYPSFSP